PLVRTLVPKAVAKALRQLHPHRVRFSVLSDRNPFMWPVKMLAPQVRAARKPVAPANPLLALEKAVSSFIVSSLDAAGATRDALSEATFLGVYGLPLVQAMVGLGPGTAAEHHVERDLVREADAAKERAALEARYEVGGASEAAIRALVYVVKPEGSADERGFSTFSALRKARRAEERLPLTELKRILKEQFALVSLDEERAIEALPALLPTSVERRREALDLVRKMVTARGTLSPEARRRLRRVESLFDVEPGRPAEGHPANA
ncbi:MAG TPA: DUF3141 domain-containing protein, partial [Myxococcaceae bacterium]|nr:DUF3141 domain-containing protein [Myxococcaceae bacterium]